MLKGETADRTPPSGSEPEANELIDEIARHPSLDGLMCLAPDRFTPELRRAAIVKLRADRAAWEAKQSGREDTARKEEHA